MKRSLVAAVGLGFMVLGAMSCSHESGGGMSTKVPMVHAANPVKEAAKTMTAFDSDAELSRYLHEVAAKQRHVMRMNGMISSDAVNYQSLPAPSAPKTAMKASAGADQEESITNVQHAGVDEGGIVKAHGNYLVVLRRGRLFTVSIEDGDLRPTSVVDAFGPDIDPNGTWYDEMLVSNDTIVVIGYSYERGGTEVGLFHIDGAGRLTYRSTYHLRSNDYYSSRNYASRLIGSKLIFYSPLYVNPSAEDPFGAFPAVRKWHKGAIPSEFKRIAPATQVYKPEYALDYDYSVALHTVTVCDLASGDFDCKATSVIGPSGRVFYVSPHAVYIWVTSWSYVDQGARMKSMVYRMPLDGSAPSALRVSGSPVDQFSFLESEDGFLNVLVRSNGAGDGMWGAEGTSGFTALMRASIDSFTDGSAEVPAAGYRKLPAPNGYAFQNRFVGDYLLYGTGSGWGEMQKAERSRLYAVRWARGDVHPVILDHGVDRIEAMGSDAVVVGSDGRDLHFTAVRLGDVPSAVDDYVEKGASQGELRSHGFFYKPEDEDSGMLGLPISVPGRAGYRHLFENSAAIVFLRNDALHFEELGQLGAQPENARADGCRASCVDWYGNSQPLFLRGRVIALLGYEMVEGTVERGQIREMRRVNYASPEVRVSQR
jgi:hypothetical protein